MRRGGLLALVALVGLSTPAIGADTTDRTSGEGTSMMLVMDASGSMAERTGGGSTRIAAAKDGLNAVIDGLPPQQRVGFRVFGATDVPEDSPEACKDSQRIVDLGTDNRDDLRRAVADYEPVGWTPTSHALQQAAKDLGDEGQRTIVLVSDGEPTCDPDPCEVAADIARTGVDVHIDVVGFDVGGAARRTLQCVAERGNGTYYDADDAASLNQALTTSSRRSARPFVFGGTPVTGGADLASAPLLESGTLYADRMPTSGESFHRFGRTAAGTTLYAGATFRGAVGSTVSSARLGFGTDDRQCGSSEAFSSLGLSTRLPLINGGADSWEADPEDVCFTTDELHTQFSSSGDALAGQPYEFAVYEEPPITSPLVPEDAPAAPRWSAPSASAPRTGAVTGQSIADAPVVDPGTYALDISSGETQVLAVPVDWGQGLRVQLDARISESIDAAAAVGSDLEVSVLNPMRADVTVSQADEPADWTRTAFPNLGAGDEFRTGAMSWPVHPANRAVIDSYQSRATLAGLHYVIVNLRARGDDANQPYTLSISRDDVVPDAAPTYAQVEGLTPPSADSPLVGAAAGTDQATTDASEKQDKTDSSDRSWVWLAAGAAAVLVLAAAAVLLIRRAGRASGR